ncbi:hypothetical protein KI387_029526, partial [Taxus chinensis]
KAVVMAGGFGFAALISLSMAMLLSSVSCICAISSQFKPVDGFRAELVHIDSLISPSNLNFTERLRAAVERSRERLQMLQPARKTAFHKPTDFEAPVNRGRGEFVMKMAIGTPALSFPAILDTGSDLTWTQCKPCTDCYKQPTAIFDPSLSSSYARLPCSSALCSDRALPDFTCKSTGCEYTYTYGDYSGTVGILSLETFSFTSPKSGTKRSRIAFGCGHINEGSGFNQASGIVGLGRGPLSLISQLGASVGFKFSYCLTSIADSPPKSSTIFFGAAAGLKGEVGRSTPFVKNRGESLSLSTYYYLSLEGISVGGKLAKIPRGTFDIQPDGTGGFIIDSGTTITYLPSAGYDALRNELASLIKLPTGDGSQIGLDLCYKIPSGNRDFPKLPSVTFHFKGADFDLPRENYMIVLNKTGLWCLAMMPSSGGVSIFGNVQQQNYQILYDLGKNMLSFSPTLCETI